MKRILVVDDDAISAMFIATFLEEEGFDVKYAVKAADALIITKEFKPEVLITDWRLKDKISGIELAETISMSVGDSINFFVIFITGMTGEALSPLRNKFPDSPILVKPFDEDDLLKLVKVQ